MIGEASLFLKEKKGAYSLAFLLSALFFLAYFLFPNFIGADSYFFLNGVCNDYSLLASESFATIPILAKVAMGFIPCDFLVIKLLLSFFVFLSLIVIYEGVREFYGPVAWKAIVYVLVFPPFILSAFKFENDFFAFPLIFASFFLFLIFLKKKNFVHLFVSLVLLALSALFWLGGVYYLLTYSLFYPLLLIITIPIIVILFSSIVGPIIPNPNVQENDSIQSIFHLTTIYTIIILSLNFKKPPKIFYTAIPLIIIGILSPKFLILLTPLVGLFLVRCDLNADKRTKKYMLPIAIFSILLLLVQVYPIQKFEPSQTQHDYVLKTIQMAEDKNKLIENDWGIGHLINFYGGKTNKFAGYSEIGCADCVILTNKEFPWCDLLEESPQPFYVFDAIPTLKIYDCSPSPNELPQA